jgi:hypothetical protein
MFQWDDADPLSLAAGEGSKQNQALHDYAGMGPGRSLTGLVATYQSYTDPIPPTKHIATLKEWSGKFGWVDRVAAYDELQRKAQRAAAAVVREQRAAELADRNWAISQLLAERVRGMLDFPLAQVEQVTKRRQTDDGRTTIIEMNVVKPAKWSFHSAAILADVSSKIGALATGEATDRTAHVIDGLSERDLETLPLDQLLALRAQLERGKR